MDDAARVENSSVDDEGHPPRFVGGDGDQRVERELARADADVASSS